MPFTVAFFDSLSRIPTEVRRRIETCSTNRYDQTWAWHEAYVEHLLGGKDQLKLAVVSDGATQQPVGWLPLQRMPGRFPLAPHITRSLSNYYCVNSAPLWFEPVDEVEASRALAAALATDPRLDLAPLDKQSGFFATVCETLERAGYVVEPYFRFGNWYRPITESGFAEYEKQLPGAVRNTVIRKRKRLEKTGRLDIHIVQQPHEVDAALNQFEAVYARSWQRHEAYPRFIREVARRYAANGWLRLGVLRLNDQPLAAQIWFKVGDTAAIFKLVYDEQYAEYSPGSVLTRELLRQAIDVDRVKTVDYLSGDDEYKRQWMSDRREMWGIRAQRLASVGGIISWLRLRAKQAVRSTPRAVDSQAPAATAPSRDFGT
ncbi:MAG TPA: GNAT family N-acetyltransferase [Steroidobacteraceae bacterium]|nr:GNAT family N-acetyltransferase [Steroidobacteraceae bacterium]